MSGETKWFNPKDLKKLLEQTLEFMERKVQDTNISDIKWLEEKKNIENIILGQYVEMFQKVEECLKIKEMIPCTEEEKKEALQEAVEKAAPCENYQSWISVGNSNFVNCYSPWILKENIYPYCANCLENYHRSLWSEKMDREISSQKQEQYLQKKGMEKYLGEGDIEKYIDLMMEHGKTVHKIYMDNLEKVVQFLQCSEYDIDSIWECVIYYILIDIEVMGRSVLQTHKEESIKSYTNENIKEMLKTYHKQHPNYGNMITSQKFYDGLRLCKKFDSRVNIEKAGDSEQKLEYRNVSFPKMLEKILLEVCFCWSNVEVKGGQTKRLSLYEVLNVVLEKLSSPEMSKDSSNRKLLTDWVNNIDFSYNVLAEGAKSLYLGDLSSRVDLESVENWNYYTGHLIINCIWTALANKENDFFIPANNSKKVSDEQKEQLDKALYWSIEEIINLTQYFSFTETAFIAEQLYSCVGMLAAKAAKEKDVTAVIGIFNSLAASLQAMQIDKMYEYWKKLADGIKNDKLKITIEELLSENVYYREFFVKYRGKINEEKLYDVRGRYSLLYNKIEKAVLFNLYKKRI